MRIELEFTQTPEDLAEFSLAHQKMRRCNGLMRWFQGPRLWVLIFLAAVAMFVAFHNTPNETPPAVVTTRAAESPSVVPTLVMCVVLGIIVLFFVFKRRFVTYLARRSFAGSNHMGQVRHVTITDDSIAYQSATYSGTMQWSHFVQFAETANLFVLYESGRAAHMIPKRAISSAEEVQGIRAFLQMKIKVKSGV